MKFDRDLIINKLGEANAIKDCHRCGNQSFTLLDGFSSIFLQQDLSNINGLTIGGPVVPVVYVICTNCGAVTPHAIGALGLLSKNQEKNNE